MHFGKRNGFDKGRLYLAAVLLKRRRIVALSFTVAPVLVNLFAMSRAVMNVCCSARETIYSSCLGIAARARPDRIKSLKSIDYFHRLSQYFAVVSRHI